jgi:acetyl esterase/lipase
MTIPRIVVLLFLGALVGWGQQVDQTSQPRTIPLWENGAPGALGNEERDKPTITVYPIWTGNQRRPTSGAGVIIAPGGSYIGLAANHEGRQVANFFNSLGVTAFVLRYRLAPQYHHPIELGDAQRAIRMVRAQAKEFGVSPDSVGMMGFSAGGHLTSTAGTHFDDGNPQAADPIDRVSSRPDFIIMGYPVISFTAPYAHMGSAKNLLGDNPDPKLLEDLSNEFRVTAQTPPTFLYTTSGDTGVPAENSIAFYLALHKARVPAEIHVFEKGQHGLGLGLGDPALSEWPKLRSEERRVGKECTG